VSIKALLSGADGADETIDMRAWKRRRIAKDELLWVDAEDLDADERALIRTVLELDDDAASSLEAEIGRPDATVHAHTVEVRIILPPVDAHAKPVPLRILVGDGWIITSHAEPATFLEQRRERITDQREIGLLTPVQFLASVLDWQVDAFFAAADRLENEVDELDDAALRTDHDLLDRLVAMRRRVARIRRLLSPHRELYAELSRPDFFGALEPSEADALASLTSRLDRAGEAIGHAREMLIGTFDIHMTRTAQRTNDIMRVLTLASVILLPSVVLAGVMGMNFRVGLFENPDLFWVVLLIMIVMALATVGVAKWRRWL
jgi:Mg2+ and Co2+ transporter CorA